MASSDGLSPSKNPFAYVQPTPKMIRTRSGRDRVGTPIAKAHPRKRTSKGKQAVNIRDSSPLPPSSPPRPAPSALKHAQPHHPDDIADEHEVANLALDDTLPISSDGSEAAVSPKHEVPWYAEGQNEPAPEYRNSDFSSDLEGQEDSLPEIIHDVHQNASAPSVQSGSRTNSARHSPPTAAEPSSGPSDPFGFFSAQRQLKADPLPRLRPHAADRLAFRRVHEEKIVRSELPPTFSTPQNMKFPKTPHKKRVSSEFPIAKSVGDDDDDDDVTGGTSEAGASTPSPVKRSSGSSSNANGKRPSPEEDEGEGKPTCTPPPPKRTRTRSTRTGTRTRKPSTRVARTRTRGMHSDDDGESSDEAVPSAHEEDSDSDEEEDPRPRRQPPRRREIRDFSSPPPAAGRTRSRRTGTASTRAKNTTGGRRVLADKKKEKALPAKRKGSKETKTGKRKEEDLEDDYDEVRTMSTSALRAESNPSVSFDF